MNLRVEFEKNVLIPMLGLYYFLNMILRKMWYKFLFQSFIFLFVIKNIVHASIDSINIIFKKGDCKCQFEEILRVFELLGFECKIHNDITGQKLYKSKLHEYVVRVDYFSDNSVRLFMLYFHSKSVIWRETVTIINN